MSALILNLRKEYWRQILSGEKKFEYRLVKGYWTTRLIQKYDKVEFRLGYPKNSQMDRIIICKYEGYEIQEIVHPLFGTEPVTVYAIKVGEVISAPRFAKL